FGHMAFWYRGENNIGPYYYFEAFPFLALMTALGLTRLWRWTEARKGIWRAAFLTAAGAVVITSAAFMVQESRRIQASLRPEHEFIRHLHSAPENALIAIDPDLPARLDMLAFNPRGLDSQPLIVRPYKDAAQVLLRYLNGRNGYRLDGNGARGLEAIHITPLNIVFDPAQSYRLTGGDEVQPDGRVVRTARAGRDAGQMLAFGQFCCLYASRFAFEADLVWSNVSAEAPVWMDVATDDGRNVLVRHAFNGDAAGSVRTEFSVPTPVLVEPRIYYGGSGDITVGALRIVEMEERARQ
ncbi:MAG: hypothetical protein ABIJ53_03315, partial [Verrucomicrobiota bacterium]